MSISIRTEEVVRDDDRTLKLTRACDLCGKDVSMYVQPEAFDEFVSGRGYVQELFPYLTADERELLLNGFCGPCFDSFCPPEDD